MVKISVWYGVGSCKCECEPLVAMCDFNVTLLKMIESGQNIFDMLEY
jgi:hypothetical protein